MFGAFYVPTEALVHMYSKASTVMIVMTAKIGMLD